MGSASGSPLPAGPLGSPSPLPPPHPTDLFRLLVGAGDLGGDKGGGASGFRATVLSSSPSTPVTGRLTWGNPLAP